MAETTREFRDVGILPADVTPPTGRVRAHFSTLRVAGQYIGTAIVLLIGLGFAGLFLWVLTVPLNILGFAAAALGCGTIVHLATRRDYRWVELDGTTIRAKHLYTGRVVERSIDQIESLGTMIYPVRTLAVMAVEHLLGRVKGIEIRFRDRRMPLRVMRSDPAMTNAKELIEAIVYRMSESRAVQADVITFNGQPLVRRIFWRGETPFTPKGNAGKVMVVCLMVLAFLFGMVLAFMSAAQGERYRLTAVPPQEISLQSLVANGPGTNRYITLTGFRPGGFAFQQQNGRWTEIWLALFPDNAGPDTSTQIAAVLSTTNIRSEAELRALVRSGKLTGICSTGPRRSWGGTVGSEIRDANPGTTLDDAWSIEHIAERPKVEDIRRSENGATGCFAAVILLSVIAIRMSHEPRVDIKRL